MFRIDLTSFEPEKIQGHTSKGDQPKWRVEDKWYKADHMGYEALAEVMISKLLEFSNIDSYVKYAPIQIKHQGKEYSGCVSQNFRMEKEMLIPFERVHRAVYGRGLASVLGEIQEIKERIQYTVECMEKVTGLAGLGPYLTMILELDAFFLNEDRHTNNLAVIRNDVTKAFRLCPVFDQGLALLSDMGAYPMNTDIYTHLKNIEAKPFSCNFDEQVDAAEELYGMQLKFSFTRQDVECELQKLEEYYDQSIRDRVSEIISWQMRKYPIYFR